jgi:hypothetical protein
MPEHLRALVVVLGLSGLTWAVTRSAAVVFITSATYTRWRNLWFGLTVLAFIAHSFWIYALVLTSVLGFALRREAHPVGVFFLLLFLVPAADIDIPGLGLINYFFTLNHPRLLAIALLLPLFWRLWRSSASLPLGRYPADRFLLAYLLLAAALQLREANLTSSLRGAFYLFTDIFLPYYVVSRGVKTVDDFKHALLGFVLAVLPLAAMAVWETFQHWNLYSALVGALGTRWGYDGYLARAGLQRANVSTGQPIPLGYVMSVALGFFLYLQTFVTQPRLRWMGALALLGGLAVTFSRGPWVGAAVMLTVWVWLGPRGLIRLVKWGLLAVVALPVLSVINMPGGGTALDLLPFVGQTEVGGITYREELLSNALIVIERNFWLGSVDFLKTPEMLRMIQGEGIIDLVNTYISVALRLGVVGLAVFVGIFVWAGWLALKASRKAAADPDTALLGRTLVATLAGTMLTIFTVSSITVIPVVYWSLVALCVAYAQMVMSSITYKNALAGGKPAAVPPVRSSTLS